MQVEDMPTRQLFRRIIHRPCLSLRRRVPRDHILPTDNTASSSQSINFRLCCVRIPCIHVSCRAAVFDEVEAFSGECSEGEVERDDVIDREDAGEDEDGIEKGGVDHEFDGVYAKGSAKIWKGEGATYNIPDRRKTSTCSCLPMAEHRLFPRL